MKTFVRTMLGLAVVATTAGAGQYHPAGGISDPVSGGGDGFGASVAGNGTDVIVGAPLTDAGATDSGAAYLATQIGAILQTYSHPTPRAGARFGAAVAGVAGNVLVGAPAGTVPGDPSPDNAGKAFLFDAGGTLLHTFQHPTPVAYDHFGAAVAGLGPDVVVGSPDSSPAAAFVFDGVTGTLALTLTRPPGAPPYFGYAVTTIGGNVLVGAPGTLADTDPPFAGAAYLFDGTTGALLRTFTDPTFGCNPGGPCNQFGYAVGQYLGDAFIGAPQHLDGANYQGGVFAFDVGTGALTRTITTSDPAPLARFGSGVASAGNVYAITAPGALYYELTLYDGVIGNLIGGSGFVIGPAVADAGLQIVVGSTDLDNVGVWDQCGNGDLTPNEECDDGNSVGGDGCSATCSFGNCPDLPREDCYEPFKTSLKLKGSTAFGKDRLQWQLKTPVPLFGFPITSDSYNFCVYDYSGGVPFLRVNTHIPEGGTCNGKPCWRGSPQAGWLYKSSPPTVGGIERLRLGRNIKLKARGEAIPLPPLPMTSSPQVTVTLNAGAIGCWRSDFTTPKENTDTEYKARAQ